MDEALSSAASGQQATPTAAPARASKAFLTAFTALLIAAAVILMGLPQLLRTLPVTPAISIPSLEGQVSGAYVTAGERIFKLFPYPAEVKIFPQGAAVAGSAPDIVIKSRTLDQPGMYTLRTYPDGGEIAVKRAVLDQHTMRLIPVHVLAAGKYYVRASQDSAEAGWNYFYFSVSPSSR